MRSFRGRTVRRAPARRPPGILARPVDGIHRTKRITLTVPLFGLYPQSDFRVTDGRSLDCPTIPQPLWYFERETIAVPKPGVPVTGFTRGVDVATDLRGWL